MVIEGGLQLEIVTPEGVVLSQRVQELVAPSVQGEFGVLPGHLPMLAALDVGLLHYTTAGGQHDVAVGVGFAEVAHDRALVITDRYSTKEDVEVLTVREKLAEVDERIDAWEGDLRAPERLQLIEDEQWLAVQLELIGDPPVPRVLETNRATDYRRVIPPASGSESEAPGQAPEQEPEAQGAGEGESG